MGVAADIGLDPVRGALLAEARQEAERLERQAADRAATQVAEAEEQVEELVGRARSEGGAAAELEAATELALARRRARALVLEARRAMYDEVRRKAHAAAQGLRAEPRYGDLVERLASRARQRLGAAAEVEFDPTEGGVIARLGNRRVDYTLPALVEHCLAVHAIELDRLWE
jgi:vacuolar-type H+-ATPase subunit E/Vma4